MFQMAASEIGGAVVRRVFSSGGKQLTPGTRLSSEEVLRIPTINRSALINKKYIEVYPKGDLIAPGASGSERFVVSMGFGKFIVLEGKKLCDPIDREQAYALAGQPVPAGKPSRAKKAKPQ